MTSTTRSSRSRERVLVSAESVILHRDFTDTSIDDIIDKASITRGGFFYHFDGKPGLAEALMRRYLEQDDRPFKSLLDEASELIDQQYSMAQLVSHDTLAKLFIAVIEGGILLARNLNQN